MLKRHEVEILLRTGHAQTEVARLAGVSLCSVKRIEEAPVVHVDDAAKREKRRIREAGYPGGKTALYALVASLRPKEVKLPIRFEGLPGEFSQHDFGQVDVAFLDGSIRHIHFFASRLKYSRYIRVSVVKNEAVESLVRNLAEHVHRWGGVPLPCVSDRPKTVALKWRRNGEVTEWKPIFAYAMLENSMPATLYLYADRVRIVAGRYEVNHPQKFVAHEGSTLAAHRAALVAAVSGKRGKRYLKRQQLLELGEPYGGTVVDPAR